MTGFTIAIRRSGRPAGARAGAQPTTCPVSGPFAASGNRWMPRTGTTSLPGGWTRNVGAWGMDARWLVSVPRWGSVMGTPHESRQGLRHDFDVNVAGFPTHIDRWKGLCYALANVVRRRCDHMPVGEV